MRNHEAITGHVKVTRDQIVRANDQGLRDRDTGDWLSYYTPTLQVAYNLGQAGRDISGQPDVAGYRYGKAPESYISHNHADDRSEHGLSLAAIDGEPEVGSSVWFADRRVYRYTGLLAGRGSDGEPLILCYQADNRD